MDESVVEQSKMAGMCPHGNFPSSCEQCMESKDNPLLDRARMVVTIGRSFSAIDEARHSANYNELYNLRNEAALASEFLPEVLKDDKSLSLEHVSEIEQQAIGMALVTSSQIIEKKRPERQLKEDGKSLADVIQRLGRADTLLNEVNGTNPEVVNAVAKKILVHRGMKEETITPTHIEELKASLLAAKKFLIRKAEALRAYSGK